MHAAKQRAVAGCEANLLSSATACLFCRTMAWVALEADTAPTLASPAFDALAAEVLSARTRFSTKSSLANTLGMSLELSNVGGGGARVSCGRRVRVAFYAPGVCGRGPCCNNGRATVLWLGGTGSKVCRHGGGGNRSQCSSCMVQNDERQRVRSPAVALDTTTHGASHLHSMTSRTPSPII